MRVRELITLLQQQDPDARVTIMIQPTYPFECEFDGLAVRRHYAEPYIDDNGEERFGTFGLTYTEERKEGNDVVLLAGNQIGYGNRDAWDAREFGW